MFLEKRFCRERSSSEENRGGLPHFSCAAQLTIQVNRPSSSDKDGGLGDDGVAMREEEEELYFYRKLISLQKKLILYKIKKKIIIYLLPWGVRMARQRDPRGCCRKTPTPKWTCVSCTRSQFVIKAATTCYYCGEPKVKKREIKHRACKFVGKYSS
jgi:hypothetical protein